MALTLILPPNYYRGRGKYTTAYVGMVDVDSGNGKQGDDHVGVTRCTGLHQRRTAPPLQGTTTTTTTRCMRQQGYETEG